MWNPVLFIGRYIKAHHVSRAALVGAGLLAAVLFFAAGAALRLLVGPVSLGPLGGALQGAVADAVPGLRFTYDQAAIEWSRDQGRVNLVVLGARAFDREGRIIAQAPKADVDLAAAPLLHGRYVVRRITLVGVQLTLVRTKEGGLHLGVEKDTQEGDILKRLSDALDKSNGHSALKSFAIRDARLAFYDETTGLFVVSPKAGFALAMGPAGVEADLDADIELSGHPAHLGGHFALARGDAPVTGTVTVAGLDLGALGSDGQAFAMLKGLGLKLDLTAAFAMKGPHLASAEFDAGLSGTLALKGLAGGSLAVKDARIAGRYDGARGRLTITDASLAGGKVRGHLSGHGDFVQDGTGALTEIDTDLRFDKVALDLPGLLPGPVGPGVLDLRGAWLPAQRSFRLDRLAANFPALALQAQGRFTFADNASPAIEAGGTLAALGVRDLLRYWPLHLGPGARAWIAANMPAGTVGPARIEAHIPMGALNGNALPDSALAVDFPISGATAIYMRGLTPLTAIQGMAHLRGDTFAAEIASARAGDLVLSAGHVVIPDLHEHGAVGDIGAHVEGAVPDVLALVDLPPLQYPQRFGIDPAASKGAAALDLSFYVPMERNLKLDDLVLGIKAKVTDFGLALGPHLALTDGAAAFDIDNKSLHATGTTGIGGSAARLALDWREAFHTADPTTTRIQVKGTLDERARAALGLPTGDFLKGPVGVTGTLQGHRGALKEADLRLDLTQATVRYDLIGVDKPAGVPVRARIAVKFGPGSVPATEDFHAAGPGVAVSLSARYDAKGRMIALAAPQVEMGPANDFALTLARGAGGLTVMLSGKSLDGSRLAAHGNGPGDETFTEPFHASAHLDRLVLREGVSVSDVAFDMTGIADRPATMTFSGAFSKTATISGSIAEAGGARQVRFDTNDAGLLAKGLFGFSSLRGGSLQLRAILPGRATDTGAGGDTPDYQGTATVTGFRVLNQPFLARLFTAGSLGGMANLLQGQGVAVDTLTVPLSSKNGVVAIHGARATGPALGVTADGYIDRPKNTIALKGTLVPLFGLNSVLGNIPILGDVLTSKKGEGIIGMTYSVTGNADEPSVSVNPLSVLAPGILRRIFEGHMPRAADAPSNAKKPAPPH